MTEEYIVIGNGIAGITAAEILRSEDAQAEITVIADDPLPAYYRPALKDYLAGRVHQDRLWARPASFYQDRRIRFLHAHVSEIQAGGHRVVLHSGQQVGYHRLLLACGARASCLSCPGYDLQGVATLRTIADYQSVRQRLATARRIVVSGSGTLALETIETLRHRGFPLTHLVRRRTLWSDVLDQTASDLVLQQERRDGVEARLEEEIAEISGKQGQVSGVVTTTGTHIPCDLVLIAIGIEPAIDVLKRAGLPCERGLIVDEAMRTPAPDIYAAGDVLQTTDALSGCTRVIGQWYPAIQQARAAAYSMLDLLETSHPFSASSFYNATFLYGLDFASVGLTRLPQGVQGYQTLVADPRARTYRKIILQGGIPLGMLAVGERRGTLALKRALDHRVDLTPVLERVFADDFQLDDWLDRQGVPPLVLGVRRQESKAARPQVLQPQTPELAQLVPDASSADLLPQGQRRQQIQLNPTDPTTIGRQRGVALVIDHASVSRRHAEITPVAGQYLLRDLGSSNGTRVNAVLLPPGSTHLLCSGDHLHFGKVAYLFQRASTGAASAQTQLALHATGFYDPLATGQLPTSSAQPRLNADGSLQLPGAQEALAASVVETFQSAPVLIAVRQGRPEVFYIKRGQTLTLGREQTNVVVLPDMAASRKHAEVFFGGDGFYLRDLDSANGVTMNAILIDAPYRLTHGDRILIGGSTFYFLHQAAGQSVAGSDPAPSGSGTPACPACGAGVLVHARFCAHCAAPLGCAIPANI